MRGRLHDKANSKTSIVEACGAHTIVLIVQVLSASAGLETYMLAEKKGI